MLVCYKDILKEKFEVFASSDFGAWFLHIICWDWFIAPCTVGNNDPDDLPAVTEEVCSH